MKRIFVFLLVLAVAGISQASVVSDANLRTAVINQLNLDTNYPGIGLGDLTRPTAIDMNRPSFTFLDANSLGISNLTGLNYATNLTKLYLCNNNLTNISLLSGLTKMKYLYLWQNFNLADLSSLAAMTNLRYLQVFDCNITDIGVVSNFTKLEGLSLGNNLISNISPVNDINTLKYLSVSNNDISNIYAVADINGLLELDLSDNYISDINALSGLTNIVKLKLHYNNITDINALKALTKLQYLYLSYNVDIRDINALKDMNSLVELTLTDVNLTDISPLADVNQIKYLWLGLNQIEDINALTNYNQLTRLNLFGNPLSLVSRCYYLQEIVANNNGNPGFSVTPSTTGDVNTASTNWHDLQIFAAWWLRGAQGEECDLSNAYCHCADLDETGGTNSPDEPDVNFDDYVIFADLWMSLP